MTCVHCGSRMRGGLAVHHSTQRHQRAIRPKVARIITKEAPAWRFALRHEDEGTAAQNRAAARRLGLA